jgi:hypothetical protein
LESPERVANLVVFEFQTTLFAVPFRVASDFEAESFVVAEDVRLSNDSENFALAMPLKGEAFASNFP